MTAGDPERILIAEDDDDIRLLLGMQLEREGFAVVGRAADGRAAVEQCRELRPDAVVLDLLMPVMSGFEAIPELRRVHPDVHIVAYTAVAGDFVRNEMARLEVPLLLKSGDVSELARALRREPAPR